MSILREQLRTSRGESARRGKALQLLQGIAVPAGGVAAGPMAPIPRAATSGASASATNELLEGAPGGGGCGVDYEAVASAAAAAAAAATRAVDAERAAREAVEAKLRECRLGADRKTALVK